MEAFLTFFPAVLFLFLTGCHFLLSFSEKALQGPSNMVSFRNPMTGIDSLCIRTYENLIIFQYGLARATVVVFLVSLAFWLSKAYLGWLIPEDPLWHAGFLFLYDLFFIALWCIFFRQSKKVGYLRDFLLDDHICYAGFRKLALRYAILQYASSMTASYIFGTALGLVVSLWI